MTQRIEEIRDANVELTDAARGARSPAGERFAASFSGFNEIGALGAGETGAILSNGTATLTLDLDERAQTLKFTLGKDELQFWSPQTKVWAVESSTFDVWAGGDSTATEHAELVVE